MSSDSRQPDDAASSFQQFFSQLFTLGGIPELDDWKPFIVEQQGQTDRGLAILGGTYLEWRVREAIKSRLPIWDNVAADDLFGTAEKTSSLEFSDQCKLAYALGLVGKISLRDLRLIGEIRNKFAHRLHVRDFNNPSIGERIKQLQVQGAFVQKAKESGSKEYDIDAMKANPREFFIGTVHMLGMLLVFASAILKMPEKEISTFDSILWRL